jgi:hypothetical protein
MVRCALLVLVAVIATACASTTSPAPSSASLLASTPAADALETAIGKIGLPAPSGASVAAVSSRTSGDWAIVTAGSSSTGPSSPVAPFAVVLAHLVNGSWQIVSERDTSAFCAALAAAPADLVNTDVRDYFVGCH